MYIFRLFALLSGLLPVNATAQDTRNHYLHLGPGWSYNTTGDEALSPLLYRGHSASLAIGYETSTATRRSEVSVGAQYGRIRSDAYPVLSAAMLLTSADIVYRQLHYTGNFSNGHYAVFVGGGLLTKAVYREHNRFSNNAYQYDYASSFSIEARIQRTLPLRQRSLHLGWGLSLPFLSAMVRPGYNSSIPEGFVYYPDRPVKAVLASAELGTFVSYWRVLSAVDATYHLLNGNELRIRYTWDLYRYANTHPIISATHAVGFHLLFNLSKPS